MAESLAVIENRDVSASSNHRCDFALLRRREIGQLGMPLREQMPSAGALGHIGDLRGLTPCKYGLYGLNFGRLVAYCDRNPIVPRNVREFLAVAINQEIQGPTFIGVADDGRLRPSIGPGRIAR